MDFTPLIVTGVAGSVGITVLYVVLVRVAGPRRRLEEALGVQGRDISKVPNGYCPNHATGVKLPEDFKVTPLQYVD